jgi:antitoxin component YwqK of YwqJK toxin-antitoxin module
MECFYHNGLLDGPTKTYYPSKALKEEGQYAKGQKSGVWKTYNEDGEVIAEESYGEQIID